MRVIIAGSRHFGDEYEQEVREAILASPFPITEVICGMADGVDFWGAVFAADLHIPVREFPAEWKRHGKAAGPKRNALMAYHADALLLVWDGQSVGSANMKATMQRLGKPFHEVILPVKPPSPPPPIVRGL